MHSPLPNLPVVGASLNLSMYMFMSCCTGSSGELTQVVQYLRKQQDILSAELQLAKQESARLRSDAAIARRAAEAANAQLAGQAERSRASARTEEEHAALMQKMEQLNLLRESNAALRWLSDLAVLPAV